MSQRTGKELILATREFTHENRLRSWFAVLSTLVLFFSCAIATLLVSSHWAKLGFAIISGLFLVRMFVIYHDHQHHAILDRSKTAALLMRLWGIYTMTPSSIWCHSHNTHHAHNSKLRSAHVGSFPVMTVERYKRSNFQERFKYLAIRHPITIALGYITVFVGSMCVIPLLSDSKRHRDALFALIIHALIYVSLAFFFGLLAPIYFMTIPCLVGSGIGAYLFYSQHNFPTVTYLDRDGWTYEGAALESSSFCKMGPIMNYFTANIGYHHIHHLNAKIPYYRLPEALAKMPELQQAKTTSLSPMEMFRCLRLKVWDVQKQCMVSLAEAKAT